MDHSHHHHDHSGHDHAAMATASFTSTTGTPMSDMVHEHSMHGHGAVHEHGSFHGGLKEVVLFSFWQTSSPLSMILTCIVVVLLCFVLEATRWCRIKKEAVNKLNNLGSPMTPHRLIDACLHAFQLTISYLLMLVFMTFNVWLCIATIVGEVIARLLFTCFLPVEGEEPSVDTSCCT